MFFRQYYLGCLSHASYLIGDTTTGRAVVVDPAARRRRVPRRRRGARPDDRQVLETHFHADFLSGHLELAAHTGATIGYGRAAAGRAEFPIETFADGDRIQPGRRSELEIRETPGHTPESISIVVYPHGLDGAPYGVLTGDTLFIGDVGRPDLLASVGVTADELARQLYHSLHDAAAHAARRDQGLPGPRRRVGVRQEPLDRDRVDDRRAAPHELRARPDERGRVRRGRHPGPVGRPAVLRLRRQPQPRTARPAHRGHHRADADDRRGARPPARRRRRARRPRRRWPSPPGTCAARSTSASAAASPSTPARSSARTPRSCW